MPSFVDSEGRRVLDVISAAAAKHRFNCGSITFRGDRESCRAVADAADTFVSGAGSRLLTQSENGDADAHRRLIESGTRIAASVNTAFTEIAAGSDVRDLVRDIAKSAGNAARFTFLAGVPALGVGIGAYVAYRLWSARKAKG